MGGKRADVVVGCLIGVVCVLMLSGVHAIFRVNPAEASTQLAAGLDRPHLP